MVEFSTDLDRGGRARRVGGVLFHTCGRKIIADAQEAHEDPERYVVDFYSQRAIFPHFLVGQQVHRFADPEKVAAHAAWHPWEARAYRDGTWTTRWARDYNDAVVAVRAEHYREWIATWAPWRSPAAIATFLDPRAASPNAIYVGVELLATPGGFTQVQMEHARDLLADLFGRYLEPHRAEVRAVLASGRPHVRVLTHSDIGPCRRTDRNGRAWDPGDLDWAFLASKL